jgi:hypothetical protein
MGRGVSERVERDKVGPVSRVALPEPYIDARQLAAVMGVSPTTIKRMVREGMPSETWGMARTRRYLASECIAWARERSHLRIKADNNHRARRMTTAEAEHREE